MKNTILWDFDGTIADRPFTWSGSFLAALDEHASGHAVRLEEIRGHIAKDFPWHQPERDFLHLREPAAWWTYMDKILLGAATAFGHTGDRASAIVDAAKRNILDPSRYQVFPDVVPVLDVLKARGWRHIILSNNHPELEAVVRGLGLGSHFDRVFTSALIGYEKPRNEIYDFVLREIGPCHKVWMVGDNENADAFGAEHAGIPAILVRTKARRFHRVAEDLHCAAALIEDGA